MKIITGMHRSGTSAVAGLFYKAGAAMGEEDIFYPADRWNPAGYFEPIDVIRTNMALIHGPWGRLAYLRLPSAEIIARRARRLSKKISGLAERYRGKLVKDNRFCLTLGAWRGQGAAVEALLICLREPIQTARSLQKRNRISLAFALRLWREHYERLLGQASGIPVWFIHYNRVLRGDAYGEELAAAFDFLGCPLPESEARELWQRAVRPSLNHYDSAACDYPAPVNALWRELSERHRRQFVHAR